MMRRRAFALILLTGFLLGATLLLLHRRGVGGGQRGSASLPDGARLILHKASFGTNHELVLGRLPELDGIRRGQPWVQRWMGLPTERLSANSDGDGLCLFYLVEDEYGRSLDNPPWAQAIIDEHGCRLRLEQSRGQSSAGGVLHTHQTTTLYPRRDAGFMIEFGQDDSSTNNVRLHIANPRRWRGTNWEAEPLPASRQIDGLRVTLLDYGASAEWPYPRFRLEQGGVETTDWRLERILFEDATGNKAQAPQLCRHEAAWRIEAGFDRPDDFDFGPDEAWMLHEGALPGPGEAVEFEEGKELQGVRVRVLALGGPGAFTFESRGDWVLTARSNLPPDHASAGISMMSGTGINSMTVRRKHPWVALTIGAHRPDHVWLVAAADASGKYHRNRGWSRSGNMTVCELDVPEGTQRARIKFILQRLRTVAFTVPPPSPAPR